MIWLRKLTEIKVPQSASLAAAQAVCELIAESDRGGQCEMLTISGAALQHLREIHDKIRAENEPALRTYAQEQTAERTTEVPPTENVSVDPK